MAKYVKELIRSELEKKFDGLNEFLIVNTKGVGGNDNNELRGELKAKGIGLFVVRNSLMKQALDNIDMSAATGLFEGPCTVAWGGDSVVDVAKDIKEWCKKIKSLEIKGAFLDGTVLDAEAALELANMKSRSELQGDVIMLACSPGARLASVITTPASNIAGCIKTLIENLENAA